MNPALNERLVEIAQAARSAPHGRKDEIYRAACDELGIAHATLQRKIGRAAMRSPRKQRVDSGKTALTRSEAELIAAYIRAHTRQTGKGLMTPEHAVKILRANGEIMAARVDQETGEVFPLSTSSIRRALKTYGLDVDTLNAPPPAVEMAAKHPNHVWELDASICVLYYLPKGGLAVMDAAVFEKNKPGNFKKVEKERVWRYAVVDKCTGAIYLEYVFGGESGSNVAQVFLNAIYQRDGMPFYGVPWMVYVDPGCANTSSVFKNLARGLQIDLRWHMPGNARATGSVEKAHDIIERDFEGCLASHQVNSLDELNILAVRWMHAYNSHAIHSRHNMTRYGAWSKIGVSEFRLPPARDITREMVRTAPELRKVSKFMSVEFRGDDWDVAHVPDICVGHKVLVCRNPWRTDSVQIVQKGENGHDVFHLAERIESNEWGYRQGAVMFGEEFKRHADTPAQKASKELDRLITGEVTEEAITKAKRDKKIPFGGRIDAFKTVNDATIPCYLPKRGTALDIPQLAQVVIQLLTHTQAAMRLRGLLGRAVGGDDRAQLVAWYPDGVPEEMLQAVADRLEGKGLEQAPRLAIVK